MEGASWLFQLPRVARITYNLMVPREWNMEDICVECSWSYARSTHYV